MSNRRATHRGGCSVSFTATLPEQIIDLADAQSGRCGETRSGYIRRLIENDLRECGLLATEPVTMARKEDGNALGAA